mgnify:CR=1 FL=1
MSIHHQAAFNSGEIGSKAQGRTDLDLYRNGCDRLENFEVLPQGGVGRRNGTDVVKELNADTRIIPFQFDADESYVVELSDASVSVTANDGSSGKVLDMQTPLQSQFGGVTFSDATDARIDASGHLEITQSSSATFSGILTVGGFYRIDLKLHLQGGSDAYISINGVDVDVSEVFISGKEDYTHYFTSSSTDLVIAHAPAGASARIHDIVELDVYQEANPSYTGDEKHEVQFTQSFDTMILTHPNHPPKFFNRINLSPLVFEYKDVTYDYEPFEDLNDNSDNTLRFFVPKNGNTPQEDGYVYTNGVADGVGSLYAYTDNATSAYDLEGTSADAIIRKGFKLQLKANHDFFESNMVGSHLLTQEPTGGASLVERGFLDAGEETFVCTNGEDRLVEIWGNSTAVISYGDNWADRSDGIYEPTSDFGGVTTDSTYENSVVGLTPANRFYLGTTNNGDWLKITDTSDEGLHYAIKTYTRQGNSDATDVSTRTRVQRQFSAAALSGGRVGFTGVLNVSYNNWEVTTAQSPTNAVDADNWTGLVDVERSTDGGKTWNSYIVYNTSGMEGTNKIVASPTRESANTFIRVRYMRDASNTGGYPAISLEVVESDLTSVVKILDVVDSTTAWVEVKSPLVGAYSTPYFALESFSERNGYPAAAKFFQNRLWFSGSNSEPSALYASVTGDYYNFLGGSEDDLAIKRIIDNPEKGVFLEGKKRLFLGTEGGFVSVGAASDEALTTQANVETIKESSFPSKLTQPLFVNGAVLYAEKSGEKLRELIYNSNEAGYVANNLNVICDDILRESPIKQIFAKNKPDTVVYCVQENGNVAALTYERGQQVVAWSRLTTDGNYKSGTSLTINGEEQVWWVVERNGSYLLEKESSDTFVDSGLELASGIAVTTTPARFVGKDVYVLREGKYVGYQASAGATIIIPGITYADGESFLAGVHTLGLNYESMARPLPVEPVIQGKLPNSRVKGVSKMYVKFYNTKQASVGEKDKTATLDEDLDTTSVANNIAEMEIEEKRFYMAQDFNNQKLLEIKQTLPYPMTVLSLSAWVEVYGG